MDLAHSFPRTADRPEAADPREFSIVLGGPLYQLLRRAHISGDALELARRRVFVVAMVGWLPLAILAFADRLAGDRAAVPFVKDIEVHVRFLVAVPLLVAAELLVHMRLRPVAGEFVARGLVPEASIERFRGCLRSAFRLRNSVAAEIAMLVAVYALGVPLLWRHFAVLDVATWYSVPTPAGPRFTPPGYWYAWVSIPLFQFLLLRWYFRIFIWMRFLWQVSRIRLSLSAMHGDLSAGLGFLSGTVFAFVPLLMAHGALLAGNIGNRVLYLGAKLPESSVEIAIFLAYLLALVVAPLAVFAPQISEAKRRASREYSRLAQRYVRDFEAKWIAPASNGVSPPRALPAESELGSADIQSLADMANSLATVRATRSLPVTRDALMKLALATLAPLAPLLLTMFPARELATRLIKLLL